MPIFNTRIKFSISIQPNAGKFVQFFAENFKVTNAMIKSVIAGSTIISKKLSVTEVDDDLILMTGKVLIESDELTKQDFIDKIILLGSKFRTDIKEAVGTANGISRGFNFDTGFEQGRIDEI